MIKKFLTKYFEIPDNFYRFENRYLIIATMGGIGYVKKAPGTVASFIALIFYVLLFYIGSSVVVIATVLFTIVGLYVCEKCWTPENPDPKYIVIDELAGQGIALLLVGHSIILAIVAFLVFRLLDITKPWIIKSSETSFKGGTSIMIDDILAGFFTLIIVLVISIFVR
ncbi:MAG: phosphatidylglycerophosphatase A [Alphaproteobacteria bacterium]|jgi:phosphatidylglycerophosphatase A|nr:phosphatidylglycerophosphatase A [Alphaproteobacteria bacterium]